MMHRASNSWKCCIWKDAARMTWKMTWPKDNGRHVVEMLWCAVHLECGIAHQHLYNVFLFTCPSQCVLVCVFAYLFDLFLHFSCMFGVWYIDSLLSTDLALCFCHTPPCTPVLNAADVQKHWTAFFFTIPSYCVSTMVSTLLLWKIVTGWTFYAKLGYCYMCDDNQASTYTYI